MTCGLALLCLSACEGLRTQTLKKLSVELAHYRIKVELAATAKSRQRGLMYRSKLDANEGMLFVFPYPHKPAFWMKNTFIPLDLGYFSPEARLIEYFTMQPGQWEKDLPCLTAHALCLRT